MNLFKQVRAFSRGRYAAHLYTNGIPGEEEMGCAQLKEGEMRVLLLLLSLLVVRRMRREHVRTMSKSADKELSTLLPCFINIFVVVYCCLLFEKMGSLYHRAFLSVKRCFPTPQGFAKARACACCAAYNGACWFFCADKARTKNPTRSMAGVQRAQGSQASGGEAVFGGRKTTFAKPCLTPPGFVQVKAVLH